MAQPNRYMTAKEVAAFLGMSLAWIYRRTEQGGGPPFRRRGRKILFLRSEIERWDEQSAKPRANGHAEETKRRRVNQPNSVTTHVA